MTTIFDKLVPLTAMRGENARETALLLELSDIARDFIQSYAWCKAIQEMHFGMGIGGIFAVFLVRILPGQPDIDELLWIVVGDLPPAYLVVDQSPTPAAALRTYIQEMRAWVASVYRGDSVEECIPVNVEPTLENAASLERRLSFLESKILSA